MSLSTAIALLEESLEQSGHGTPAAPEEGSAGWFLVRANALGLSMLRNWEAASMGDDPAACERLYRGASRCVKAAEEAE